MQDGEGHQDLDGPLHGPRPARRRRRAGPTPTPRLARRAGRRGRAAPRGATNAAIQPTQRHTVIHAQPTASRRPRRSRTNRRDTPARRPRPRRARDSDGGGARAGGGSTAPHSRRPQRTRYSATHSDGRYGRPLTSTVGSTQRHPLNQTRGPSQNTHCAGRRGRPRPGPIASQYVLKSDHASAMLKSRFLHAGETAGLRERADAPGGDDTWGVAISRERAYLRR
jgi:hypothetical protein